MVIINLIRVLLFSRTLEADTANDRLGLSYEILPPPLSDAHKVFHIGDIHVFPKYTPLWISIFWTAFIMAAIF